MFTRRNWLLRCSILINIAVILYICSHVMIGGGGNFATGPAYFIQSADDVPNSNLNSNSNNNNNNNNNNNRRQIVVSNIIENQQQQQQQQQEDHAQQIQQQQHHHHHLQHHTQKLIDSNSNDDNIKNGNDVIMKIASGKNQININQATGGNHRLNKEQNDDKANKNSQIDEETIPGPNEEIPMPPIAPLVEQHRQQQQQQQQAQQHTGTSKDGSAVVVAAAAAAAAAASSIVNNVVSNGGAAVATGSETVNGSPNVITDEKRFEVPTDSNEIAAQEKSQNEIAGQPDPNGSSFVNNSNTDNYVASGDEKDFDERLRSLLKCHDRDYIPETLQRGDFWVLKNYVRADHGELKCHETVTYTTHADYTFLDNLIPLLERWNSPVSIAIHAPGGDFQPTVNSIKYLRDCLPESNLVRQLVTFHIYFSTKHIPKTVPKYDQVLATPFNCTLQPPFIDISSAHLYKTQKKLLYPVNVGRNIARDAALTHFILASDIELYPNPGLVKKFLEMIARNDAYLQRKSPRVFPLSIFEVESSVPVPKDKTELQELLRTNKAIPFHKRVCSSCHGVPKSKEWMATNETEELGVFHIGKRVGYFVHWEPIYIGTHADPHYDERLSWEGKSDKMTQGYALCALDYEFHILDNAFLVHKPGIKVLKKDPRRAMLAAKTNQLIKKIVYPELKAMYGTRPGCAV